MTRATILRRGNAGSARHSPLDCLNEGAAPVPENADTFPAYLEGRARLRVTGAALHSGHAEVGTSNRGFALGATIRNRMKTLTAYRGPGSGYAGLARSDVAFERIGTTSHPPQIHSSQGCCLRVSVI